LKIGARLENKISNQDEKIQGDAALIISPKMIVK
jgi:hypothetical protein